MVKGDDAVAKRRNKARRRKQNNDGETVSARIASIIAAKKRRHLGVRRKCQGMCYSLPSIEDPFNDNHGKTISNTTKKKTKKNKDSSINCKSSASNSLAENMPSPIREIESMSKNNPSKFMSLCLSTFEREMQENGVKGFIKDGNTLFSYSWGLDFLKCYTYGRNVLDTSGDSCNPYQIAWLSSIAADSISRKEKDGAMCSHPFFLFLVPSLEGTKRVRSVCKCLKNQGFHTISIHSNASIDYQIEGLKKSEPEFLVATPERLSKLIALKAIDLSGVSFLVIDEAGSSPYSDFISKVESIKQAIHSNPFTVLFSASWHNQDYSIFNSLLRDPVSRISSNSSLASLGASIRLPMYPCCSEHEKLVKCIQVLRELRENKRTLKALCVVSDAENSRKLKKLLVANKFCVSEDEESVFDCNVIGSPVVYITKEENVLGAPLERFETILVVDFVDPEDVFAYIVMRMGRDARNGVLFSFLTEGDCLHATKLIRVVNECGHEVPDCLRRTPR